MYGSHDMRHTGFRRLTVVNGTPGFWGVTFSTSAYDGNDSMFPLAFGVVGSENYEDWS